MDGTKNNFMVDKLVQYLPPTSARKTIWATKLHCIHTEGAANEHISMQHPAMWRFTNPAVKNELGYPDELRDYAGIDWVLLLSLDDWPLQNRPGSPITSCG